MVVACLKVRGAASHYPDARWREKRNALYDSCAGQQDNLQKDIRKPMDGRMDGWNILGVEGQGNVKGVG